MASPFARLGMQVIKLTNAAVSDCTVEKGCLHAVRGIVYVTVSHQPRNV